ncbi:hypothetical protein HAX54_030036 [Datura stramonium]|uniref:Bulb-type lectin domain-containing protein n=1 Tax=Datura stramonium TaxID=4076 RepID=A0ABS8V9V5_DATST|nr:hypothetical protein [Datura stramonium]
MAPLFSSSALALLLIFLAELHGSLVSGRVHYGSRLLAKDSQAWFSDNGTFAFGFIPAVDSNDQYQLAIWFAQLPGDTTLVWSPNINSPVSKDAILEFDTTGNLLLMDGDNTVWGFKHLGSWRQCLDKAGSFGIVYGSSSDGAVYVYKNDGDYGGLSSAVNQTNSNVPTVLRRLTLEVNGNLRLYRWDNDVNGSRQWVPEWAAVSNPWTSKEGNDVSCSGNSSVTGKCGPQQESLMSQFKISTVQKTNYYFSESSVIGNYSDRGTVSKCGDACLSNCDCVASVYGLSEEKAYCWLLQSLEFGGFEDPVSTLFVKVEANASASEQVVTESS